ncbi:uncharacterized protein BDR25DRAFT_350441 [Lindgomyces ingoldianus]|uniref:Uncharacterized protein n=1 Tax=Lindgomyces ingoldianus TaxID=673940 RepID=A0ACB6RBM2_9PLEO|nr:uncharacterized protein BDR25DRAFT_350441 [Lindgomyces ingoldianus]KAF2476153.1 hypothetical protein BDR25DRAFT_350441 [Lindgomyces ingoldianus]
MMGRIFLVRGTSMDRQRESAKALAIGSDKDVEYAKIEGILGALRDLFSSRFNPFSLVAEQISQSAKNSLAFCIRQIYDLCLSCEPPFDHPVQLHAFGYYGLTGTRLKDQGRIQLTAVNVTGRNIISDVANATCLKISAILTLQIPYFHFLFWLVSYLWFISKLTPGLTSAQSLLSLHRHSSGSSPPTHPSVQTSLDILLIIAYFWVIFVESSSGLNMGYLARCMAPEATVDSWYCALCFVLAFRPVSLVSALYDFSCLHLSLFPFILKFTMPKPKKSFIQLAQEKIRTEVPPSINSDAIFKGLEDQRRLEKWDEFIDYVKEEKKDWPIPSVYDVKSLKYFVYMQAAGISGTMGMNACVETVHSYWNQFTSAWARKYGAIRKDIITTVTNHIYTKLRIELELLKEKKPQRYANGNHLKSYADAYWGCDWKEYNHLHLLLGARRGTGRGLKFKVSFSIAVNSCRNTDYHILGEPKLAIRRIKDAKNTSNDPDSKKPKNTIEEGRVEAPLYTNSLLFTLARLLSRRAFRDHSTIESLLDVIPPKNMNSVTIAWRDDILEQPVYYKPTRDTDIETANAYHTRITDSGIRAGLLEPPTTHDWRAYVLFLIGQPLTRTEKHTAKSTTIANVALTAKILFLAKGGAKRLVPLSLSRAYNLERSQEYVEIEEEIEYLWDDKTTTSKGCIKELQAKRSALIDKALKKWQKNQPYKPNDLPMYHYGIFNRCRFMMPERDRLATNLFKSATLRSTLGLSTLRDLVALLSKNTEVEFRPGLEETNAYNNNEVSKKYDWRHIYNCYKKDRSAARGFAELCFKCNEWVLSEQEWKDHCAGDLQDLDSFSIYFDPLIYSGVLATPGYCPYYKWLLHIQKKHMAKLEKRETVKESAITCPPPHPNCPKSFHSVLHLEFHLEDIHGIPLTKKPNAKRKRPVNERKQVMSPPEKRCKSEYDLFINSIAAKMDARARNALKILSSHKKSYHRCAGSNQGEDMRFDTKTPPPLVSYTNLTADRDFVLVEEVDQMAAQGFSVDWEVEPYPFPTPSYHSAGSTWSEEGYPGPNTPLSSTSNELSPGTQPSIDCQVPVVDLTSEAVNNFR